VSQFQPFGLCCAVIAAFSVPAAAAQQQCVNLGPHRAEIPEIAREAVALLRSCGHDPDQYHLELSQDDRFSSDTPSWTVEFHPRRPEAHYPLGIRMDQPCLLRWLAGGESHPRQREVMRLVREMAGERGLRGWNAASVAESAGAIGIELRFDAEHDLGTVWRFLLDREDLSLLDADPVALDDGSMRPGSSAP
jgi:hypothetical protein